MNKAKEISALWEQIKPQVGELVRLCRELESHYEVTADAYQRGYENGFIAGHLKAEKSGQSFYEDGYQRGINDAWEAARKICAMDARSRDKSFGAVITGTIIEHNSASEAIEKIRQYEQEKQFCVCDEFEIETGQRFVILKMDGAEIDRYIDEEGRTYSMNVKYRTMCKTGRHFPEIAEVLQKMKEK